MAGEWDVVSVTPAAQPAMESTNEWDVVDTTPLDPGDRVNMRMDNLDRSIGTIADSIKGPTTEPGMGNQFVAGIKAGAVGQNASMTGGALEAGSVLATGHLPTPDDFFGSIGKDLQEWGEKKTPQPRVASIADVPDFSANWKRPQTVEESDFDVNNMDGGRTFENFSLGKTLSNFGDYAAYKTGANIGTSLPSLAVGGAARALATSNPAVGFIVGAIGPSYVQNLGDVYTSAKGDRDIQAAMKKGKVTPAQIAKTSALAAIPIAAFDSLGLEKVMGAAFKPARDALVTRILKGMATGAIVEGSTEGLQDIVSQWALTTLGQNKDWGSRVIEVVDNVLGGVFGGAAMGGAGGALPGGRPSTQPDAAPPAEPTVEDLMGEPLSTPTPDGGTVTDVAPPVMRSNLSPTDQRIREIRDAVNAGRPVPPGPRGQLQEVPVEDVELAPPPAETDIAAAAQDLYDQMREPAPAANIDVQPGGDVTQVELAPPPVEQPTPVEPPASNIDVSQPFDDIENIDAAPPPQPQRALPPPSMAVDSQGNAQPQSQAEQARREFTQKERVQYDQMQKRAAKLEAKGDTEGAIAIRRKMVGLEQQTVVKPALALPAPVMAVDSQGNAQLQSERDNAAARQQAASADVERQATELERAGKPEEAIALRREAAGYTQPEGDNARAARSRAERLPPNWTDNRLARSKYRYGIRGMAEDLVKGGDITYTYDENGKINGRTPSVNPDWFQGMNANPDTSMSTEAVKAAVEKALAGKPLGVREARVVGAMIDTFHGERGEQVDYAKQQLEAARKFRKTAAEAIGITDEDVERAGELLNEREYRADWDGPTRSLYEMADEARAVDPDTTQSILESSASDADVARQLAEVIHGRTQRNQEADPGETQAGREIEAPAQAQGAQEARTPGPQDGAVDGKILGYDFEDIQRAQQGGRLSKAIDTSKPATTDENLDRDIALLEKHGKDGLEKMGYGGVLDRLNRAGLLETKPKSGARAQLEAKRAKSVEPSAKIEDFGEKIGGARKDDAVSTGPRTAKAKTEEDDKPGWMNRYQIGQIMRGDVDQDGRFVIRDKRLKDRMGQAKQIGRESFATREEAEKAIPLYEVARNHSVSIRSGQGEKNYAIIRKVTDHKRVTIKDGFKSNEEAMRYMAEHAVEIIETKTGFGEEILVKPEKAMRAGPERRTGPATAKMFADTFGFRAVEFGNWETQDERQEVMNHAYDGLLDLAELIGVPPKAISLNGDLALAFGARGHGLSGARAHYERDRAVINLTKMQGAGALGHEWMHAVDHYFGRQDMPSRATKKQNEDGTFVFATAGREDYLSHGTAIRDSGMRKELRDAYVKMVKDLYTKAEKYVEDTAKVEQFLGKQRDQVDRTLKDMRAYMSRARDWKKRNNKAATVEQLAEWDALAEKILDGGDLTLTYKNSDKKYGSGRYTNDTVEALSAIYKTVTGSAGFTSDRSGAMDGLVRAIKYYQERIGQVESAAKSEEKTRKVPTSYAMEAKKIDQGRASDYWSTEHEMLARAFSSYVEDKLKADKKASEFLSFGSDNKFYTLLGIRPFPVGEEREAMGKAFDEFFRTVETRETDKGVGMFSKRDHQWGEVTDTATGPMYSNDDVTLFPAGVEGAGLWENEAVYSVVDNETGQSIGEVVVGITDGQIDTVYWIESYKKGAGTRIMRAITANSTVTIDNIMDTAKGFWDKLGIYDYDGRNAKLDWQAIQGAGRSAQGVSGGVREGKGNADPARSRGNAKAGLSPEGVQDYLERKVGKGVKRLIESGRLKILASTSAEIPRLVKRAIDSGNLVFGYTDTDGTTYLIADNLNDTGTATATSEDAYAIFLHEVGVHYGMRAMLGDSLFESVIAEAKAAKGELGKAMAAARKMVPPGTNPKHVDEEALAWMVTDRANHELSLIKRVIAKIRAWLLSKGFVKAMNADALVELARGAADKAGGRLDGGRFAAKDTDAFKRWFAGSKVVDKDGEPLVVYHGTDADFTEFNPTKRGKNTGAPSARMGDFFASDPAVASSYAAGYNAYREMPLLRVLNKITGGLYEKANEAIANAFGVSAIDAPGAVLPVYLSMESPLVVDYRGDTYREKSYAEVIALARDGRHDGVILKNTIDPGSEGGENVTDVYVTFSPTQIKSATGNNGNFDPSNSDIRFARRAADQIAEALDRPAIKKGLKQWYKDTGAAVVNAIDAKITPLATMAGRTEYLTSRYLTLGRIAQTQQEARRIYDMFRKLSDADGQKVYAYLTDTEGTLEGVDATTKANATRVKKMIEQTGQALVERGVIPQESFDKYQGRYLPRVYLAYLLGDKAVAAVGAGKTLSAQSYAKSRDENLPQEYRDIVLGEIKDPAFLASRALGVPLRDLAILNWLSQIAQNPNWVLPGQTVEWTMPGMDKARTVTPYWLKSEATRLRERAQFYQGQNKTDAMRLAAEMDEIADAALSEAGIALDQVPDGYKQVPNSARYGAVRGLIVVKDIYDDIVGVGQVTREMSMPERVLAGDIGRKVTAWWKISKVSLNPPAQIRNVISNLVLLNLSGVPMHKIPSLVARAAKEVRTKGKYYQIGVKYGITESTFAAQEMQRIERETKDYLARQKGRFSLAGLSDYGARMVEWAGDKYQLSEMMGKLVKIMDSMEREGKSEADAAMAAQEWLFDYSLVGPKTRYLRSAPIGAPFLTFAVKVLPRMLEVAITHPMRFLPYYGMFFGMQMLAQSLTGADDDDLERLEQTLPEWLQEKGHVMMLPFKDDNGRWQFLDMGYFFPWTYWTEIAKGMGKGVAELATGETDKLGKVLTGSGLLGGPIPDMLTAIKTGKDSFTGRDIIDDHMTAGEKLNAMLTYLYGMAMPPFLTGIPPFHDHATSKGAAGHIYEALTGTTDKRGEPRSTVPQALLRLVGVNVYGVEPEKARERNILFKTYEISKTVQLMKSIAKDQSLDSDDREELIDDYKAKIMRMKDDLDTYKKESVVAPELR